MNPAAIAAPGTTAGSAALLGVLIFATAIWIGGYVTIGVVNRSTAGCLPPELRVVFFRRLGHAYSRIGTAALVVALASGATLLRSRPFDGREAAAAGLAVALAAAVGWGMAQARRMGWLRRQALDAPADLGLARLVSRAARRAALLRTAIGAISLALLAVGVSLGVR